MTFSKLLGSRVAAEIFDSNTGMRTAGAPEVHDTEGSGGKDHGKRHRILRTLIALTLQ